MKLPDDQIKDWIAEHARRKLSCTLSDEIFRIAFPFVERINEGITLYQLTGEGLPTTTLAPSAEERAIKFASDNGLRYQFEPSLRQHHFVFNNGN